jgi:hypothetical protein
MPRCLQRGAPTQFDLSVPECVTTEVSRFRLLQPRKSFNVMIRQLKIGRRVDLIE